MKTNEFIKEVEALGFDTRTIFGTGVSVNTNDKEIVLIAGGESAYKINCCHDAYDGLAPYTREKLFKLAVEYASTPVDKREEEKKYYIKLKDVPEVIENVLNFNVRTHEYYMTDSSETQCFITKFTKKDIKDYGLQKFADSDLFELVEVK